MNAYQHKYKFIKMPSVLEFYSYILFFSASICGPAYEYSDYIDFIHQRNEFKDIPSPYIPTLKKMFWTLGKMYY